MACCILAAFLLAQFVAMLRRWGIFWGLVKPDEDEDADTIFLRMRGWLKRPQVRVAVSAVLVAELSLLGSWLYVEHGTHIYQEGDKLISSLHGEQVIYTGICGNDGTNHAVRIVLSSPTSPARIAFN